MALNRIQAARLLSDKEMALFEGSLSDQAPQMSDKQLQGQIRRVRTQRDKYQDLLRRQRVSTRDRTGTKSGSSGVANARTDQKVQVFSEALERLEKQQARRERSAGREAARPAAGRRSARPAASKSVGKTTVRSAVKSALEAKSGGQRAGRAGAVASGQPQAPRSSKAPAQGPSRSAASAGAESPPVVPHAKRMQEMGQQRTLAHVSSRGRRQQARRDSR
jgi:hypothetical protein